MWNQHFCRSFFPEGDVPRELDLLLPRPLAFPLDGGRPRGPVSADELLPMSFPLPLPLPFPRPLFFLPGLGSKPRAFMATFSSPVAIDHNDRLCTTKANTQKRNFVNVHTYNDVSLIMAPINYGSALRF